MFEIKVIFVVDEWLLKKGGFFIVNKEFVIELVKCDSFFIVVSFFMVKCSKKEKEMVS